MKTSEYMSWENFSASIIVGEEQRTHQVSQSPIVDFFWDGDRGAIGLLIETGHDTILPPELLKLNFLEFKIIPKEAKSFIKITSTSKSLRRQFYHFAVAVAERLLSGRSSSIEAVITELKSFDELLTERIILSIELQIGLIGELLLLERIIKSNGLEMLDCWVGPNSEPHDFRVKEHEFEVKTTLSPARVHVINGSEQMVPSQGCTLFLLSVLIGPPGESSSFSLASKIKDIDQLLASDVSRHRFFKETLQRIGVRSEDLVHYERRYSLRRHLAIVPVDDDFPALTRPAIQKAVGKTSQRIESVQYAVNVEGLEKEEGTQQFASVLPE